MRRVISGLARVWGSKNLHSLLERQAAKWDGPSHDAPLPPFPVFRSIGGSFYPEVALRCLLDAGRPASERVDVRSADRRFATSGDLSGRSG